MILKRFAPENALWIQKSIYQDMELSKIEEMIAQWNSGVVDGRLFEMLAICSAGKICGLVSLYEQEKGRISLGIEVIPEFRRMGIGTEAGRLAAERAGSLGYRVMVSQVRQDNAASIALHRRLGFQKTTQFVNGKGNSVFYFQKQLR